MITINSKADCCGCHACFNVCPTKAITMKSDAEGFLYPDVNALKCVNCHKCETVCPQISKYPLWKNSKVYACYRKDLKKRLKSASGGIFAVMAEEVLLNGGLVAGAAFDGNWILRHKIIDNIGDLNLLLGSKYIQSEIGDIFKKIENQLSKGNKILFCGTPCQVQGLKKYLGKDYDNLITLDLVCHGVPSPKVWSKYILELSENKNLINFIPRDKSEGIDNAPLIFEFSDGSVIKETYAQNSYIKGFIKNLFLRPSCYSCKFKGVERCSDFTLGDFWGVEKFYPEFYDKYGISLLFAHNQKAEAFLKSIKKEIVIKEVTPQQAIEQNPCIVTPVNITEKRNKFFELWDKQGVVKTVDFLTKPSFKTMYQTKIQKIIENVKIKAKRFIFRRG